MRTRFPAIFVLCLTAASPALASNDKLQFPDASETPRELQQLWEDSNSTCRSAHGGDVKVAAACLSRSVYGAALNERDWCLGREGESNAEMSWHECGPDSLRFPLFSVPKP